MLHKKDHICSRCLHGAKENQSLSLIPTDGRAVKIDVLMSFFLRISNNIRLYQECEGRKENSVPRIAVWHHEAC